MKFLSVNKRTNALLLLIFSVSYLTGFSQVVPGIAPVNPPTGGFHIEGNLQANTPTVGKGDWVPGVAGAGGNVLNADGSVINGATTFHLTDPYNTSENNFSGGKKFNDNPNIWTWVSNNALAKCDINNALFHFTSDPATLHTWLIVAADRRSNSGNAYIDFEFLQNTMTDNDNGSFSSAGPNGGRTQNDLLLTLALTNGGGSAEFFVNSWQPVAGGFDYVDKTTVTPAGSVYASTNAATVPVPFNAFGISTYSANLFVEAAIDITALLGAIDPCTSLGVKTLFIKTKTSQSPTATIVDFIRAKQVSLTLGVANAGPDQSTCSNIFSVTGTATPSPGDAIASTKWTVFSGAATIASPNSASSGVTVTSSPAELMFTVKTVKGCTVSDIVKLTVTPAPPVNAGTDFTKTCVANISGGTIGETAVAGFTYSWTSSPAGFTSTASNPTVNPSVTTTYTVTKTQTTSGCSSTDDVLVTVNNTPVTANAGTDFTKTCVANTSGGTIGETAVAGFTYSWTSSPAGFTSTASNPTVNPSVTTTYTVTKTNTASGCFSTDGVIVTVNNTPVTVNAGTDFTKTCIANTSGGAIGETAVAGFTYSWTSSPAGFTSTASNPTVNPAVTTTYTVTKTNTASGCFNTDDVIVTVNNTPVTVNAGTDFTKTCIANTSGGAIGETAVAGFTYSWTSSPAGFTSTASNPTVNPSVTTTYTVTKTNTASGCFSTDDVIVTVNSTPVTVDAGTDFTKTCVANTSGGTIGETAAIGFTYAWTSSPAGFTSSASNPTVNPSVTTTYTVTKTNTASGCSGTDEVIVTVNNTPVVANAGTDFTKTCLLNTGGKQIGEATAPGFTYSWSPTVGLSDANISDPIANPTITITYTVTKTNSASGCSNTDQVLVTVNNAAVTANAGTDFTKTCVANTSGGTIGETAAIGFTYAWTSSPAGFTSSASNPTVNPSVTTTYTVTKTNTASGCSGTDEVIVTVNNTPVVANAGTDFTKTCLLNTGGKQIGEATAPGFTYSWSPTVGLSDANISDPIANPTITITYTVTKTNSASGCSNTDQVLVTVNNAAVTANAGTDFTRTCVANTNGGTIGEIAAAGFTYSWTSSPAGFTSTSSNPTVNPSVTTTYSVIKTNTASGCSGTDEVIVTVSNAVPDAPTICVTQPSLCGPTTGSVTILTPTGEGFEYSIDNGAHYQPGTIFADLAPGSVTGIKVKDLASGCVSGAVSCDASTCDAPVAQKTQTNITQTSSKTFASPIRINNQPTVKAYPNPFSDRIKFVVTSPVAGSGNLEVYNSLGQKVKTVFKGSIIAGSQTFELNLPNKQTANMVYVLRIGDKKLSGKIMQINE